MTKGFGRLLQISLLASMAWAAPTHAANSLSVVFNGGPHSFTDADGVFSVARTPANTISFNFTTTADINKHTDWIFIFSSPANTTLGPGTYDAAQYGGAFDGAINGIQAGGWNHPAGSACLVLNGQFIIRELTLDGAGKVLSFAADADFTCSAFQESVRIRFNSSIPIPAQEPTAYAGTPVAAGVETADTVQLDGSNSKGNAGDITSYQWTQSSGPSVVLDDASAVKPSFTAPAVPAGGADVVMQLTVTNSLGLSSSDVTRIRVMGPTDPQTYLYTQSDPGDAAGDGLTQMLGPDHTFTVSLLRKDGFPFRTLQANVSGSSGWMLELAPPYQQAIQPGVYDYVERFTTQSPVYYGFTAIGSGLGDVGCNQSWSRVVVWDYAADSNGNLLHAAIDFEQHCEYATPALHGYYRYKSAVPLHERHPVADPGFPQDVPPGYPVTLDATLTTGGGGGIVSYQWTQLSGPPVVLDDPTAAKPAFSSPDVPLGGADLVFQLTVTNSLGLTSTRTVTVHVHNPADPYSAFYTQSDPGDLLGQGRNYFFTPLDGLFAVGVADGSAGAYWNSVYVTFNGGVFYDWPAAFQDAHMKPLRVRVYDNTGGWARSSSQAQPQFALNTLEFCPAGKLDTGRFIVRELVLDKAGKIDSLAIDSEQHCGGDGAPAQRGIIRYNSTVPLFVQSPLADAGDDQTVAIGATVNLDGSHSDAGAAPVSSYQWVQLSGPQVTLADPTAAVTSFLAPYVAPGGADVVLGLIVTNQLSYADGATVKIHINNPDVSNVTELRLESVPGDTLGAGQDHLYRSADGSFTAAIDSVSKVLDVEFTGSHVPSWSLHFQPPRGQPLAQLFYLGAGHWPSGDGNAALRVSGAGRDCTASNGRFDVRELKLDSQGKITALAVDFVQYCGAEYAAPLYGKVRYHSSIPSQEPDAYAGRDETAFEGLPVSLDGSRSDGGDFAFSSYTWTQVLGPAVTLSDPHSAKPSFTAPAAAGGVRLAFQLVARNVLGLPSPDVVVIDVEPQSAVKQAIYLQGGADDPVAAGMDRAYTSRDTAFSFAAGSGGITGVFSGGDLDGWTFAFSPPADGSLRPGVYRSAGLWQPAPAGAPGLLLTRPGAGCVSVEGEVVLHEIQLDGAGGISRLAADVVQYCNGAAEPLRAMLRYNSSLPLIQGLPLAVAGPDQLMMQPGTVILDGSASEGVDGPITAYQWTQVAGPAVQLSDPAAVKPSFTLDRRMLQEGTALVFQLQVSNAQGATVSRTRVIPGSPDPMSSVLYLQSDTGDPAGTGQSYQYVPLDARFTFTRIPGGVRAQVSGQQSWSLTFVSDHPQVPLHTGTYKNAVLYSPGVHRIASLDVHGPAVACTSAKGEFTVRGIEFKGTDIASLAIDFVQHCNGAGPALRGTLQYQYIPGAPTNGRP